MILSRPARSVALITLAAITPAVAQSPAPARLVEEARGIADRIAAIRGLPIVRPIDFRVSDRATVRAFAEIALADQMPADQWEAYEALLVHTRMIPPGPVKASASATRMRP